MVMSNKTKYNHAPPHGTQLGEHGIISAIVAAKGAQPEPNHEETPSWRSPYKVVCSFQSIQAVKVKKRLKETKYIWHDSLCYKRLNWLKWKDEWNQSISNVSIVYGYIVKCSLWEKNAEVLGADVESGQHHTLRVYRGESTSILSSWLYKK